MAEYENPGELLAAAENAYSEGYREMDAYSPMPIHGLADAIGFRGTRLPLLVFIGGLTGCILAYLMLWSIETIIYPLNIGGRPHNSWPAFIPIMFETTILLAALTAVLGMLAMNGLPTPYHPVFNNPRFVTASRHRFFLCIESRDPKFNADDTTKFLERTHPRTVAEVEW
jgi:hypothetical protein